MLFVSFVPLCAQVFNLGTVVESGNIPPRTYGYMAGIVLFSVVGIIIQCCFTAKRKSSSDDDEEEEEWEKAVSAPGLGGEDEDGEARGRPTPPARSGPRLCGPYLPPLVVDDAAGRVALGRRGAAAATAASDRPATARERARAREKRDAERQRASAAAPAAAQAAAGRGFFSGWGSSSGGRKGGAGGGGGAAEASQAFLQHGGGDDDYEAGQHELARAPVPSAVAAAVAPGPRGAAPNVGGGSANPWRGGGAAQASGSAAAYDYVEAGGSGTTRSIIW